MYKVFFNERILTVSGKRPGFSDAAAGQEIEQVLPGSASGFVNHFLKSTVKNLVLFYENEEALWSEVKSYFTVLRAAGGVVRRGEEILFIYRRGKWDLPKGKTEKGEMPDQTALREVSEECGIKNIKIVRPLPSTWHIYQSPYDDSKDKWILKETCWYEMDFFGEEPLIPQADEDIIEICWVEKGNLGGILRNTYPNLEQIIRFYC